MKTFKRAHHSGIGLTREQTNKIPVTCALSIRSIKMIKREFTAMKTQAGHSHFTLNLTVRTFPPRLKILPIKRKHGWP